MRIVNSIRNSSIGLIVHISIMILNFISRTYFVKLLGAEYLGLNGLFTNIISMLNLAELGVGSAITYTLYKPLALDDKNKVSTIMRIYKKIYYKIGILVLGIGIALIPFLNLFINGRYDKNIVLIFLLFLIDTIVSYFLGYKRTILEADQKLYVLKLVNFIQQLASNILAIVILILTKNYILYLLMRIVVHILEDIFIIKIVENRYSYISYINKGEFSLEEKNELKRNVKALFLHKIGGYLIFSTDNLIISKFISISTVGIFSNYTLIIESINGIIKQIINNISASYGNLIVKESTDKKIDIYNKIMFLNFWIGGVSAISLFCLINPFITLWIGNEYIFDIKIVIVMVINFYILSMRMSINIPRTTAGLFFNDRYVCIIEAVINIFTSIILVKKIGIIGVLLGTTMTSISVQFITVPYLCYKHIFKRSLREYYVRYFSYLITTLLTAIITYFICSVNINNSYIGFLYKLVVCVSVPNLIFLCRYFRTDEFRYYIKLLKSIGKKYKLINYTK